jgi:hypothetical protein
VPRRFGPLGGGRKKIQVAVELAWRRICNNCRAAGECKHNTAGTSEVGWYCSCIKPPAGPDPACPTCHGRGEIHLDVCPKQFVTPDIWDLLDAADLAEKGHWPLPGGWLSQTAGVVAGVRQIWAMEARIKASLGID